MVRGTGKAGVLMLYFIDVTCLEYAAKIDRIRTARVLKAASVWESDASVFSSGTLPMV